MRGFLDLLTVIFLSRYLRRPLHFFGGLGLLSLFAGLGINSYLTVIRLIYGSFLGHIPLLLLGILLMVLGVQFVSTGLVAELIIREVSRSGEEYSVRTKLA